MLSWRVGAPSFFLLCSIPLCKCTTAFLSTHLPEGTEVASITSIVNDTAMNTEVNRLFWVGVSGFLGYNTAVELLSQKAAPFLVFWGNSILLSLVITPVDILTNSVLGFLFLLNLTSTYFLLICLSWSFWWVWSSMNCVFNLHLSYGYWCWISFYLSLGSLYVLLREVSFQVLCPFLIGLFVLLLWKWCLSTEF